MTATMGDKADQIARETIEACGLIRELNVARFAAALRSYGDERLEEVAEYSDEFVRMLIGHAWAAKDVTGIDAGEQIAAHARSLKFTP